MIILKDTKIDVKENLDLLIEKNCTLFLNFIKKGNFKVNVKIMDNVKFNLIDYTNNKDLVKNLEIDLGNNSHFFIYQFNLGSKGTETKVILKEGSVYELKSAYYIKDSSSKMLNVAKHIGKNSKSSLIINGCVSDGANIVNDGLIKIEKKATGCVGHQSMKNLIFDENSKVNSEPILQVNNNDVICSHGSSISQIKDDILFYIESRGLSYDEAQQLYVRGFFDLVLEDLDNKSKEEICIEL